MVTGSWRSETDTESIRMSKIFENFNQAGAGARPKLGASTSEAVGRPGRAAKVAPSMSANGEGGGLEMTRPGGATKVTPQSQDGDTGFGKPGGSQAIKPV